MSAQGTPDWVKYAQVGDKIVCIDDSPGLIHRGDIRLQLNRIYTIGSITFEFAEPALTVRELNTSGYDDDGEWYDGYMRASRFRPLTLRPTDISALTALLDTKPAKTPEAVPA